MPQLTHRRAVITGAGSGIGAAIARAYAAEGARLLLADRNAASLAETAIACRNLGAEVFECLADVGTVEGAQASVDRCVEHFGGIDILVNNAGMLTQARCVDLSIEMWNDMLRVDLTSVFVASQRALPQKFGRLMKRFNPYLCSIRGRLAPSHIRIEYISQASAQSGHRR